MSVPKGADLTQADIMDQRQKLLEVVLWVCTVQVNLDGHNGLLWLKPKKGVMTLRHDLKAPS